MGHFRVSYLQYISYLSPAAKHNICRSCLCQLSTYSTFRRANSPTPPNAGFAHLLSRRLISLSGPDASRFLQGVITANLLSGTLPTTGLYAAFLNAHGRVLNDVFIYPDSTCPGQDWLVEVDAGEVEKLYNHMKRYTLRAKLDMRIVEEGELSVWSSWQREDGNCLNEAQTSLHTMGANAGDQVSVGGIGCVDSRAPGMGMRMVLPEGKRPLVEDGVIEVDEEVYHLRRYLKGVPEGQGEILRETALPQESNIDFMGGIDYRKGCYVGQELTIRTHHTGVVRKRILPMMIYGPQEDVPSKLEYRPQAVVERPTTETSITRADKRGRSAGKWLGGIGNIGLALCRLEVMTGSGVEGEPSNYIRNEFKLEWNGNNETKKMVKVKAFVPSWHSRQ